MSTVSECGGGRRELRKAQTRADVRAAAQRLFSEHGFEAVTIAEVAAAADVAVQTVFNHFESKEALFFDGRTPWVEGAVAAVAERTPGTDPVAALRGFLAEDLPAVMESEAQPGSHHYVEALSRYTSLQSRERMLVEETGLRVAEALGTAIAAGDWPAAPATDPATAQLLSRLVADLFLVAGRVLVLENRRLVLGTSDGDARRETVRRATATTLAELERCVTGLARRLPGCPAATGRD